MFGHKYKDWIQLGLFGWLTIIITYLVKDHVFFWDTIQLASKHAFWYYDNDFRYFLLPENIDSGHPPFLGMLLAFSWKVFGQTLPVSHFLMLPFLWMIIYYAYCIGHQFNSKWGGSALLLLLCADPVLASQAILISPDIILLAFFLMGLWGIFAQKKYLLTIAIIGLGLISMRGMLTGFGLFIFQILQNKPARVSTFLNYLWPYLPGGLLALTFLLIHYFYTGWIGYHEGSPWAPSFEKVTGMGIFKNIAIIGWRFIDFGRIFLLASTVYLFIQTKDRLQLPYRLPLLFLSLCFVLLPSLIIHQYLSAHRYLLPLFVVANIFFLQCLSLLFNETRFKSSLIYLIVVLGYVTGNLWIYPKNIAQGWDSTLAHLPYYQLRAKMINYIEEAQIPFESIGTVFPESGLLKYKDLVHSQKSFAPKDFENQNYILYSSIMNDFSDEELSALNYQWKKVKSFEFRNIEVSLFTSTNFKKTHLSE